ncbi:hypothetical protein [Variovorax atrisoli]|uniref:hypothetical protein n=1 Tax=Variovorax atrisoli TaxID=3394203 RepID=UPI0018144ED1|nr:hypothetical protein [Variovorax sp. BK613]MBB3642147.1 hypothetical protein [Variovorax sp. BK613]
MTRPRARELLRGEGAAIARVGASAAMSLSGPRASFVLQRERVNLLLAQLQHPLQRSAGAPARQRFQSF